MLLDKECEAPPVYNLNLADSDKATTDKSVKYPDEKAKSHNNGPPPNYEFPQTFAIGPNRTNAPLITSAQ
ncbi:hypothetical protein C0991_009330, partial [Blastosporella zonata]